MNARDEILERIRRAHAGAPPSTEPSRHYRGARSDAMSQDQLLAMFIERLEDYRAGVTVSTIGDAARSISRILDSHQAASVVISCDLPEEWLPSDMTPTVDGGSMTPMVLDQIDAVLTTCALAIAETGTIVLDGGPGQGRRVLTLVPDLHVVVVREGDVVRGVPEAVEVLDPVRPMTWISGPSATSDIELVRVEGVHGPRNLEVIIVGGDATA